MRATIHTTAALLLLLFAASCGGSSGSGGASAPARPPDTLERTPAGVRVFAPWWLYLSADSRGKLEQALAEVDDTFAALDIAPGSAAVLITIPIYEAPHSPTGLARGEWRESERLAVVGWKCPGEALWLPALRHELEHGLYGPDYGH
jgi:hypothetical protein